VASVAVKVSPVTSSAVTRVVKSVEPRKLTVSRVVRVVASRAKSLAAVPLEVIFKVSSVPAAVALVRVTPYLEAASLP
jgi:hypothetical protein